MLKGHSRSIEIGHKLFDLMLINLSWWTVYYLRFESDLLSADKGLGIWYLKYSILLTFINYYYFRREGLYSSKRFSPMFQEIFGVIKANTVSFTLFIVFTYFLSEHKLSRLFIASHYFLSTMLLISMKITVRKILKRLRSQGKNARFTVLIGDSIQIRRYAEKIKMHPEFGVRIKAWIKDQSEIANLKLNDLEALAPDSIVVGLENKFYPIIDGLLKDLNNSLFEIVVLPDLSHSFVGYQVADIDGTAAIILNEPNIRSRSVILKRCFDLLLSAIGIVFISPLLILIALAIKLTSKGPVLYSQVRMGLDGKEFKMFKFRSMTNGKANKETWTVANDPRVTKIGRILRSTSLDELPQLFNVLLGDMSLVGPRPERPIFVHQFREKIPTYMLRHKMKAGMTGWAQVNGWRGDTSIERRIECDLYYIKNWSIWMDCWIIFMTVWKGFINKNAY